MQWLKNCGKVSGALMRESGAQTACRWGWDTDFCRHGLPHVNPHAFRHTVASVLIANHTDVVTVARHLGHSSATTTAYYAHLIEESRVQASECIADVMLRRAVLSDTTPQSASSPVDNQ